MAHQHKKEKQQEQAEENGPAEDSERQVYGVVKRGENAPVSLSTGRRASCTQAQARSAAGTPWPCSLHRAAERATSARSLAASDNRSYLVRDCGEGCSVKPSNCEILRSKPDLPDYFIQASSGRKIADVEVQCSQNAVLFRDRFRFPILDVLDISNS